MQRNVTFLWEKFTQIFSQNHLTWKNFPHKLPSCVGKNHTHSEIQAKATPPGFTFLAHLFNVYPGDFHHVQVEKYRRHHCCPDRVESGKYPRPGKKRRQLGKRFQQQQFRQRVQQR
jgi:hypothetical protein